MEHLAEELQANICRSDGTDKALFYQHHPVSSVFWKHRTGFDDTMFCRGLLEEGRALHRSPMCIAISLILPYGLALETSALTNSYPNRGECDTECLDFCRVLRV